MKNFLFVKLLPNNFAAQVEYPKPEQALKEYRQRLNLQISENENLSVYRWLNYCGRINYLDSLVKSDPDPKVFYNDYVKLAVEDFCLQAKVNPTEAIGEYGGAIYQSKDDYFEISEKCRQILKCKESKKRKRKNKSK